MPPAGAVPAPLPRARRLLVAIAAKYDPLRAAHLHRVVDTYFDYARSGAWDVELIVDTDDAACADALYSRFPRAGWPANASIATQVWGARELRAIARVNAGQNCGEPVPMVLAQAHRHYLARRARDADFFVYTEEDMVLPQAHFELWVARQGELWARNWLFAFYRLERDAMGAPFLIDTALPRDPPVFVTEAGHRYVALPSSYHAAWLLTAAQLAEFVEDEQWLHGTTALAMGPRERVAVGWQFARERSGAGALRARALTPITADWRLDPHAAMLHAPNTYVGDAPRPWVASPVPFGCGCVNSSGAPLTEVPLPVHASHPCA